MKNILNLLGILILVLLFIISASYLSSLKTKKQIAIEVLRGENRALEREIELQENIKFLMNLGYEHQIIINAIAEDYPPKKRLKEREWCDAKCLKAAENVPLIDNYEK